MKKFLIPSVIVAALSLPIANAMPAHHAPGHSPEAGSPRVEHVRPDCPRPKMDHRREHGPRFHHGAIVRTFGMNDGQAHVFMERLGHFLRLEPSQKGAWEAMTKSYVAMAKMHQGWHADHGKHAKPVPPQKRLEMRAEHLEKHAHMLKDFAKSRAALEKTLTPQQMRDFDRAVQSGEASFVPPPPLAKK